MTIVFCRLIPRVPFEETAPRSRRNLQECSFARELRPSYFVTTIEVYRAFRIALSDNNVEPKDDAPESRCGGDG